jgi:ABC-type branched-subunit amino acid transport system ATPase component
MWLGARMCWMRTSSDEKPGTPARLRVEQLDAGYGAGLIVTGVDLSVAPGEIVTIIGPNGAGKSTLLKAITGQLKPAAGRIYLDGSEITGVRGDRLARAGIGYVPQVRDVFRTLTVQENFALGGYTLPRRDVRVRTEKVLEVFPALRSMLDRQVGKLSGGERKMVALGRALMLEPSLIIMDEPTAGLAPNLADVVLHEHVPRLTAGGGAVLLVEQKALEALSVADRGYVMVGGSVRLSGSAATLLERSDIREVFLGLGSGEATDARTASHADLRRRSSPG